MMVSSIAAAMIILGSCTQPREYADFTINGNIPGLKAGDKVQLRVGDKDFGFKIDTIADAGSFVIKGVAEQPVIAEIRIVPNEGENDDVSYSIPLMVENGLITVEAAHIDSLPPSWYTGSEGKLKERNVTVKGGRVQKEYEEYQEFIFPYELALKVAIKNLFDGSGRSSEEMKAAKDAYNSAQSELTAKDTEFIYAHPGYSVSTIMFCKNVKVPFKYTDDELTAISEQVAACPDTIRVRLINETIDSIRNFTRGSRYTDFEMTSPEGKKEMLSSHFGNGKLKLVDFWASWCIPCRLSIPRIKELYEKYPDKLEVISLSIDQDDKAWRKAMDDEKMPWVQFIAKDGTPDILRESYRLSAIPYLLVFSDEGNILYAGSNPREVSELLAELIK